MVTAPAPVTAAVAHGAPRRGTARAEGSLAARWGTARVEGSLATRAGKRGVVRTPGSMATPSSSAPTFAAAAARVSAVAPPPSTPPPAVAPQQLPLSVGITEVLENRIALINQLKSSFEYSTDDLSLILDNFTIYWDDSGCSGVPHCVLHKSILLVALKCSCIDIVDCLGQFLALIAKANSWYGKHLLWFVESVEEFEEVQEEEHSRILPEAINIEGLALDKFLEYHAANAGWVIEKGGQSQSDCSSTQ